MRKLRTIFLYVGIILIVILLLDGSSIFESEVEELQYIEVLQKAEDGEIGLIVLQEQGITGWYKDSRFKDEDISEAAIETERDYYPKNADFTASIPSYEEFTNDLAVLYSEKTGSPIESIIETDYDFTFMYYPPQGESLLLMLIPYILMTGGVILLFYFMMRSQGGSNGAMSFGKSRPRLSTGEAKVTFADVAGADEEKEELQEVVEFMKKPDRFVSLGARIPKGVLLIGPPGTGKTLLAKAVAGEAGVPFFSISGSDFVEMFVGVGASRVRDLFATAKKSAPAVIFMDEIDAVGRHRGAGLGGGHDEREQTLNQLLVEMDGFSVNQGIIVIAATNRPDILDPALLRPGRFDRRITVNMPDVRGREEILGVHAKNKPLASDISLKELAQRTPGFTGADLENLLNEAAILTARRGKKKIGMSELNEAITRVIMGPEKRSRVILPEDKRITAYHEAGHAVAALMLKHCDPLREVSIIPRGMAGGYTMTAPQNDNSYMSRNKLLDNIAMTLGGRAAEAVALDDICTGAYSDLQNATDVARNMVTKYGMSDRIGPIFLGGEGSEVFLGRDFTHTSNMSDDLAASIDAEVRNILDTQFERIKDILVENIDGLNRAAEALIEHEYLTGKQFETIFNGGEVDFDADNNDHSDEADMDERLEDASKNADGMGSDEGIGDVSEVEPFDVHSDSDSDSDS